MTELEFARQLAYLTKFCAGWAGDAMGPIPPDPGKVQNPETVSRFCAEVQRRIDRMRGLGIDDGDDTEPR